MIGKVFAVLVILSFLFAAASGNMAEIGKAAISGADEATELCFSMIGVMCLWSGIIKVLDKAGVTAFLTRLISPVLKHIYPVAFKNERTASDIASDCSANLLGLGNAALPLGIKAMNSLKDNGSSKKDTASDEMIMFAVLNTAPIQLIPTTLISLRNAHNSANSSEIMLPIWICSLLTTVFAVFLCKLLARLKK